MQQATPPDDSIGIRTPKACVPCAVAKVRCETEVGQIVCKRCARLKKTCRAQPAVPAKRKGKRRNTQPERPLEGVNAILTASEAVRPNETHSQRPTTSHSVRAYTEDSVNNDDEAQIMLHIFRNEMTPYFPFIIVAPWMTVKEIKSKKPFLFLVIMMISCRHDASRQVAMAKAIRDILGQSVLVKSEQSLDLLQGMLLYLAWYHTHVHLNTLLTNLVYLIMSLTIDLGLNRQIMPRRWAKPQKEYFTLDAKAEAIQLRSLEERRTYLGCYYLTVAVSITAREFEPIRYTRYTEECCELLENAAEYPTDAYLVRLVKLLHMGDRINRTLNLQDVDVSSNFNAPMGALVKSFEAELHRLRPVVSTGHLQNKVLLLHYHSIETLLCESALDEKVEAARHGSFPVTRLSLLFACLDSCKQFFAVFYSLPVSVYFDIPYSTWMFVSHHYVVLSKLSLITLDGWDLEYVERTVNFDTVMDTLAQRVQEAINYAVESQANTKNGAGTSYSVLPIFASLTGKVKEIKAVHAAKKAELSRRTNLVQAEQPQVGSEVFSLPEDFAFSNTIDFFDFGDEPFWIPSLT